MAFQGIDTLKLAVATAAIRAALGGMALGAFAAAPAMAAEQAAAKDYAIAAGALSDVLAQFAASSSVQLVFEPSTLAGARSPGLNGRYTVRDGFDQLLRGSGYQALSEGTGAYALRRAPAPAQAQAKAGDAALLPVVTVTADLNRATATGHIDGYVARHSISATKTDSSLRETPQSISVIASDEIGDRKAESLDETLRYTAGVTPNQRSLGSDDSSLLRGFTLETTGIFLDGLRNSGRTFSSSIEPYGLERLEVLRGPASVLYGQIPPGGMVNAVSKRPSADMVREVGVEYGSYQRKQLKADLGGAIDAQGQWTYRLTMLGRESDTRLDHDRDNRLYIAPSLTWQPDADTKLTLLARYQTDNQQYAFPNQLKTPGPLGQIDPRVNLAGYDNRFERSNKMLGYEFEHKLNAAWTVRQNLRYSDLSNDRTDLFPYELAEDGRHLDLYFWPVNVDSESLFVDTQLQGRLNTGAATHSLLFGLDYAKIRNFDTYGDTRGFVGPLDLFNPVYAKLPLVPSANPTRRDSPSTQVGVYAQDQVKWRQWVVTAGLRHDKAKISNSTVSLKDGTSKLDNEQSPGATTGRLGAVYLFDSGWTPYLSYATAFSPEIGNGAGGAALKPSRGKQTEAGVRYQPAEGNSLYTAAVFDLVRENVTTAMLGNPGVVVQTGEISSRGLELEARTELTRHLSVIAQYTYLDTEITSSNNGDLGLQQMGAPKHSASAWGKYTFAVAEGRPAYAALGMRYLGKMRSNSDDNTNLRNAGLTLWDAAAGFEQGAWRFSVNVNNLLNKQVLFDCGYLPNFCYRSAERTANVSAAYRF